MRVVQGERCVWTKEGSKKGDKKASQGIVGIKHTGEAYEIMLQNLSGTEFKRKALA